jgi:hypothetical protein
MKEKIILWMKAKWLQVKKIVTYFCLFLGLLAIAYVAGRCSTKSERKQQINNLIAARDSVKHDLVTIDGLQNFISLKNAIILTQKQAISAGIIEREMLRKLHLKDLITNTELSGVIQRQDSLLSLPPNTIFITIKDTTGRYHDYARIPFQLLKEHDQYLSLDAGMDINKKAWFSLSVPFSGTISVGYKKSGFLKTTPTGIFTTENQYLKVEQMDVLIIKEQEKWFQRWWVHAAAGGIFIETLHQVFKK